MIYLDNSSTTSPRKEVLDLAITMLKENNFANPNSTYEQGLQNRRLIENARNMIAEKINCLPKEITFTSSASAATSTAICGYLNKHNECHNWVTTSLEHGSVSDIEVRDKTKHIENCNTDGFVMAEQFSKYHNCLISVTGCCAEIGSIQPIRKIADEVHKHNCILHVDLTQYIPIKSVDMRQINCDMASFGTHKIHGLKNCGILYVKNGLNISPLVFGHNNLFGGTEDVMQICCAGKAIEMLSYDNIKDIKEKRDYLLDLLLQIPNVKLNGVLENRSPNNINIRIDDIELDNSQLTSMLNLLGDYCISSGTACKSHEKKPSKVLLSLGLTEKQANSSIRITLSESNTYKELDDFYNTLKNIVKQYSNSQV